MNSIFLETWDDYNYNATNLLNKWTKIHNDGISFQQGKFVNGQSIKFTNHNDLLLKDFNKYYQNFNIGFYIKIESVPRKNSSIFHFQNNENIVLGLDITPRTTFSFYDDSDFANKGNYAESTNYLTLHTWYYVECIFKFGQSIEIQINGLKGEYKKYNLLYPKFTEINKFILNGSQNGLISYWDDLFIFENESFLGQSRIKKQEDGSEILEKILPKQTPISCVIS